MKPKQQPNQKECKQLILRSLELGCYITTAARIADVSYSTVWAWLKKDPDFAEAVEQARGTSTVEAMQRLMTLIKRGNFPAIAFYLKAFCDEFRGVVDDDHEELMAKLMALLAETSSTLLPMEPTADLIVTEHGIELIKKNNK